MEQPTPPAPSSEGSPLLSRPPLSWIRPKAPSLLLPPAASSPLVLLWVWLLPQALLLFLNLQAWDLASGEMAAPERAVAIGLFVGQLLLLLGGGALLVERRIRRRPLPRLAGLALLLASSVYLAFVIIDGAEAVPASLRDWMLPPDQWVYKQFALVGPGALYGAFRLLCPDRESDFLGGVFVSILAFTAPFALLLLVIGGAMSSAFLGIDGKAASYLFVPLYLAASTLAIGAVLRVSVSAYVAARRWSPMALAALTILVALVLPLAGLALNARIPFPADFQIPALYALAVVNGLVLALPSFANPLAHRITWLAQCALFPFTAYFFAAFLPFLPLMPVAAICLGLGLLMGVPSALFLLHGSRILDGARAEMRDGPRWRPALLAALAIAAGPALLTAKILHERATLNQALDYLQYPDYAHAQPFRGDRSALRATLLSLREFKAGHYLPFYSEFYNWLAFDNLVLPETKLDATYRAFFGEAMPPSTARQMEAPFFSRSRARNTQEVLTGIDGPRPPADATLAALQTSLAPAPGLMRVNARLTLHNSTAAAAEYRTVLHVPAGVAISGMWLTIGNERVPARIFEERSALWVYQKLTETPALRDPAILRDIAPDTVELRVFPVAPNADRTVEVEFTYPENFVPGITIADQALALPPAARSAVTLAPDGVWLPANIAGDVPALTRQPTPHLIIDTSRDSRLRDPALLRTAIRHALDAFPNATNARIFFTNFNIRPFQNGDAIPVRSLRDIDPAELLAAAGPFEGGFLETRAIKTALVQSQREPLADFLRTFPAVVVLGGANETTATNDSGSLADFAALIPDQPVVWRLPSPSAVPTLRALDPLTAPASGPRPVQIYEIDDRHVAVASGASAFLAAESASAADPAKIYDIRSHAFHPLDATTAAPPALASAASAWTLVRDRVFAPATAGPNSLSALLDRARIANVLVPATAMMVVENSAQWKMLARTEKKTLKGHEALALAETAATPEPGTLALLVVAALAALAWKTRTRIASAFS